MFYYYMAFYLNKNKKMPERKEESIEAEILWYFLEKWVLARKNDIKNLLKKINEYNNLAKVIKYLANNLKLLWVGSL